MSITIACSLSKDTRACIELLFDRGSNRGVIGEDTRVISTNLDRKVSICGIGNYRINLISINSAGRVAKTTSGKKIVIPN